MQNIYNDQTIQKAYEFYRKSIQNDGFYVCLSYDMFFSLVIKHHLSLNQTAGIIDGLLLYSIVDDRCFIAYLLGHIDVQKNLLLSLDNTLVKTEIRTIWWSFYNPIKIPFYVINDHKHMNAQGVP